MQESIKVKVYIHPSEKNQDMICRKENSLKAQRKANKKHILKPENNTMLLISQHGPIYTTHM